MILLWTDVITSWLLERHPKMIMSLLGNVITLRTALSSFIGNASEVLEHHFKSDPPEWYWKPPTGKVWGPGNSEGVQNDRYLFFLPQFILLIALSGFPEKEPLAQSHSPSVKANYCICLTKGVSILLCSYFKRTDKLGDNIH